MRKCGQENSPATSASCKKKKQPTKWQMVFFTITLLFLNKRRVMACRLHEGLLAVHYIKRHFN